MQPQHAVRRRGGNTVVDQLPIPIHHSICHDISVSSPTFSLEISVRRDIPRSERYRRLSECEDGEDGEEDEQGCRRHSCSLYSGCDFGVYSFFVLGCVDTMGWTDWLWPAQLVQD